MGITHVYILHLNLILLTSLNDFCRKAPGGETEVHLGWNWLTFMFGTKPFLIRNAFSFKRSIKEHSSLYVRCWAIIGRTTKSFSPQNIAHELQFISANLKQDCVKPRLFSGSIHAITSLVPISLRINNPSWRTKCTLTLRHKDLSFLVDTVEIMSCSL